MIFSINKLTDASGNVKKKDDVTVLVKKAVEMVPVPRGELRKGGRGFKRKIAKGKITMSVGKGRNTDMF